MDFKKDVVKILDTYSVRKDEFQQIGETEYCYVSSCVKGYMLTLSEEIIGDAGTGRILVSHTQGNGKGLFATYGNVMEREPSSSVSGILGTFRCLMLIT